MPGKATQSVLKKVLVDITETRDLLNSLEACDLGSSEDEDAFMEKARNLVDCLEGKIISLRSSFSKHYTAWKDKKGTHTERKSDSSENENSVCQTPNVIDDSYSSVFDSVNTSSISNVNQNNETDSQESTGNDDILNNTDDVSNGDSDNDTSEGKKNKRRKSKDKLQRQNKNNNTVETNEIQNACTDLDKTTKSACNAIGNDTQNEASNLGNETENASNDLGNDTQDASSALDKTQSASDDLANVSENASDLDVESQSASNELGKDTQDSSNDLENVANGASKINSANRNTECEVTNINEVILDDVNNENELDNGKNLDKSNDNDDDISDPLNIDQNSIGNDNDDCSNGTASTSKSDQTSKSETCNIKQEVPLKIKCVDIKKLLDPDMASPDVINSSVVVISDSDNECSPRHRKKKLGKSILESVIQNLPPEISITSKKKVIVLDDSDTDLESKKENTVKTRLRSKNKDTSKSADTKSEETLRETRHSKRNHRKKAAQDLTNVSSFSENSNTSSDDSVKNTVQGKKKSKLKCTVSRVDDNVLLKAQEDEKFLCKAYVPLPRITAAKLKKNYEKKILKMDIERLTNLKSLKRSRRRNSESSDSIERNQTKKKRDRSKKSKGHDEDETDISDNDISMNHDPLEIDSDKLDNLDNSSELNSKKNETQIEQLILGGINSDNDDVDAPASNAEDTNSETEKETSKKRKKGDEKTKEKEESASKNEDSKSDKDDDTDAETNKRKKKWRKNKLLTENITESDSDEDFANFLKKRDKQDEKKRLKKQKRKNVLGSDSEASAKNKSDSSSEKSSSSHSEESFKEEEKKKKSNRRRIRKMKDSSDSENENDKSTRKNIRKVWKNDSLSETTIAAEKAEKERKMRIAERQKKYNQIFEEGSLEKATVDKVVLDFNDETEEEVLQVAPEIVKHLKPHQAKGIQFMWNTCFESLDRAKKTKGSGCILAHCMGLGKTLQVISLVHTLITNQEQTNVKKVLIVCPMGTVLNWVAEFKKWLSDDEVEIFEVVSLKQNTERMYQVKEWDRIGGALIIGYDMFRNLTNASNKRLSKKMRTTFQTCLVDPGPDLVICDEGHLLKNEKTSISIAMNRLQSLRRIVLTGTPLQNNLKEYFCMVQFVKPSLLGTYKEYLNRFVNPITNGQYTDSTPHDIQIMRKRSHVLHKLLDGIVQRRDYSVLAPYLPPKHEYVLFVALTDIQIKLYEHYMKERSRRNTSVAGRSFLFVDFNEFQRICAHPRILLDKTNELKQSKDRKDFLDDESEGSLKDFIDDGEDTENSTSSSSSNDSDSGSAGSHKAKTKNKPEKKRITRATAATYTISDNENDDVLAIPEQPDPSEWWREYCTEEDLDNLLHSGKITLLFEILRHCELIGDKVLIFSQSLYSLNVIEYFLNKVDEATQNSETNSFCGFSGSWSLGLDYFRLDGSSSCDSRAASCKKFNDESNSRARLFLISTRAGGLGINLVAANRVVIFDVSWNPSHDTQSIYRVYRFGQTKPCYIYRFVTLGTMEMKIYERQVIKQSISKRVIDEQQIDRHYNSSDLAELYKFEPVPDEERPIPLVPKDILLGELLQADKKIYKYHEHQSLLENKVDEVLDEEERKAAWEEFENEKVTRNYTGTINNYPIQMLQVGIQSIIRKENPTWTGDLVTKESALLFKRLQEEVQMGPSPLFQRVVVEIRSLQKAQENYFKMIQQQRAILQYQQQLAAQAQQYNYGNRMPMNATYSRNTTRLPSNGMPNPAMFRQATTRTPNPTDYIDLND